MQVILVEPVRKLGNVGDVVNVKPGFARNFLIPSEKAVRATEDNIADFKARKAEIEKQDKAKSAEAEKLAKKIDGTLVNIIRQAGEDGRLYGSVSAQDIAAAVSDAKKEEISRKTVLLTDPIKYIGVYSIEVNLHGDVSATVHPNVARSESEAKEASGKFARGEDVMEGSRVAAVVEEVEVKEEAKPAEEADAKAEDAAEEVKADDAEEKKPAKKKAAKKAAAKEDAADAEKAE
jgi:large subunit ribosomal protein L9